MSKAFKVGDLVDSPRFDRAGGTVVEIRDVYEAKAFK